MKNRKGFTIIELLAVITVLGLLIAIAIPAINKELAKFRLRYYKQVENTVKVAGQEYVEDKRFSKPTKLLYTKVVKVNDLVDKNYMEQIKDYNKKACDNDDDSYSYFVMVKTGDKKYEYQACIKCSDDEYLTDTSGTDLDLCNPAWLTNDNISYSGAASSDEVLWVYYGSSEEEVERQVGIKYGITKRDNKGNFVAQVEDDSVGSKTIYPDNINELVSGNLDQIITLRYTLPNGEILTRKAGLFRYGTPSVTMTYTNANPYSGKAAGTAYGNGTSEWANSITLNVGYNTTDKDKYNEFLHDSNNHISKIEYYDSVNKKWMSYNCVASSKESCTVTLNQNFNGTIKYRLVDNHDRKTKESPYYSVKIDKDKPTCTVGISSGTVGNNSWYTTNVGITMTARNDALSGMGKYGVGTSKVYDNNTTKTHSSDTADITYYGYVVDKAGNENTCNVKFKRDATKPTCTLKITSGTKGTDDWYRSNIGIDFNTLTDAMSGVDTYDLTTSTTASYSNGRNKTQTADTPKAGTVWYGYVKDKAGNTNSCNITVKKDTVNPTCTIKITSGTKGDNDWYTNDVTVTATFGDALSGVNKKGIDSYNNNTTASQTTDTASKKFIGMVQDKAGNEVICAVTFRRDATKPTCTIAKTNTYYTTGVNLTATCSDAMSKCTTATATQSNTGVKASKTYTVKDNAGNTGTCTMAVTSGTRYRNRTCTTYKSCSNSACGCAAYKTCQHTDCGTTIKSCATSACGCARYNSCQNSACGCAAYNSCATSACGYKYTRIEHKCSRKTQKYAIANTSNAEAACRGLCGNSSTRRFSHYIDGVGCYCWVPNEITRSLSVSSCSVQSQYSGSCDLNEVGLLNVACRYDGYATCQSSACGCARYNSCQTSGCGCAAYKTCQNAACGSTVNTCATAACGCNSYKSCRTAACGCQTWGSWSATGNYYPEASCSASANTRECASATVYW